MVSMNYSEALDFWFAHINYEQRVPTSADLGLERMRALLAQVGNPHHRLRVVHVAGTKGKGSVSAMLDAIFRRAGYRTGLFTSPHLSRIEERFQVNGEPITPDELAVVLTQLRPVVESMHIAPTFFELATAVGFLHFERRRVEVLVLEVGLGGRLDSTNVCRPTLSVITSISLDHTRVLGDRLALIAREKAGIVKRGIGVISGATDPEPQAVIAGICRERRAPLHELDQDFRYRYHPGQLTGNGISRPRVEIASRVSGGWRGPEHSWSLELNLLGEHQAANAAVVVACVEALRQRGMHLPDSAIVDGLRAVRWPARMEVLGFKPCVVLDCAHNVASAQAVAETLTHSFALEQGGRRLLLFAGSSDKDLAGMLRILAPLFDHIFLTRYIQSPRSVPPERLAALLPDGSKPYTLCSTPLEAWQAAREMAQPADLICVTGSVFLAGELREFLLREKFGAQVEAGSGV
jgi:dihydrofolate synthase / folylpolyglutamate synthase